MRRLALLALLLAPAAHAQAPSPAQMGITSTATPEVLQYLDKNKHWIPIGAGGDALDPRSFGAKCDGVTDDTTALQAWAAAVVADSAVFIPGVCVFKATITFPLVNRVTMDGPGTLLYTGSNTTSDGIVIGQANVGCAVYGWTIKRLRLMSSTKMTAGDGFHALDACVINMHNITVGDGLGGNQNWFNAVHFDGGNTVRVNNYAFSGGGAALTLNADNTYGFTDPFFTNGILVNSLIGFHLGGGVGGLTIDTTDVLQNGTNVLIDQAIQPKVNGTLFFGEGFLSDVTNPTLYPAAPQIGVHVSDPDAVIVYKGWLSSAANQCFAVDSGMRAPVGGAYRALATFTGVSFGNCHSPDTSHGSAIDNQSQYFSVAVNGGRFFTSQSTRPTIYNVAGAPPLALQGATYDSAFNLSPSPNNIVWQRVSPTSGTWALDAAANVALRAAAGSSAVIAGAGNTSSNCGLWILATAVTPGKLDSSSAGCTYDLGQTSFPFNSVTATTYKSGALTGFSGTKTGAACVFTITGGIITNVTGC